MLMDSKSVLQEGKSCLGQSVYTLCAVYTGI